MVEAVSEMETQTTRVYAQKTSRDFTVKVRHLTMEVEGRHKGEGVP